MSDHAQSQPSSGLGQAALALAAEEASIFPLLPGDKRPWHKDVGDGHCKVCKNKHGRGLRDATMRPEVITEWWTNHPDANIGLATGKRSGVVGVDVDPRHGGEGSLSRLFQEHGAFPDTLTARTQSGGWHYLFLLPKGRVLGNTASKIAPGIDTRGENGYVAVAPSQITREDGSVGTYEWIKSVEPVEIPEWVLKLLPEKRDRPNKGDHGSGQGLAEHLFRLSKLPEASSAERTKAAARAAELVEIIGTAPAGQSFATTSAAALEIGRMIARRLLTSDAVDVYEAAYDSCEERAGCEPDHVVTNGILYALENTEATFSEALAGIGSPFDVAVARWVARRIERAVGAAPPRQPTQDEQIHKANLEGAATLLDDLKLKLVSLKKERAGYQAVVDDPMATPQAKADAKFKLWAPRTTAANIDIEIADAQREIDGLNGRLPDLEKKVEEAEAQAEAKHKEAEAAKAAAEPTEKQKLAAELRNKAEAEADVLAKMKAAKTSTIRSVVEERLSKGLPAGKTKDTIKADVSMEVDAKIRTQAGKVARAERAAKEAEREVEDERRSTTNDIVLIRDKDGNPKKVSENILEVLRKDLRFGDLRYDEFSEDLLLGDRKQEPADLFMLNATLQREYGLTTESELFERTIYMFAQALRGFHPVKDYLNALPAWDREPRLFNLARIGFGARNPYYETEDGVAVNDEEEDLAQELDGFHSLAGTKLMIGAIARIMDPTDDGVKVDTVVTLVNVEQGTNKSSAISALCPRPKWFSDTRLELASKDKYLQIKGKLLYEWAEIDGMNKHEASDVKAFLSSPTDNYRPPYAKRAYDVPRRTTILASVNKYEFIHDVTGGRRFVPIVVGATNPEWIIEHRDQLWAEALYYYRMHQQEPKNRRYNWWYEGDEHALLVRMVEPHLIETSLDAAVKEWLDNPMFVPPSPAEERAAKEAAGEKVGLFSGAGSVGVGLVQYKVIAKKPDAGLHFTIKEIEAALNTNELLRGTRGVDMSRVKQVLGRMGWEPPPPRGKKNNNTKHSTARGTSSSWWMKTKGTNA